MKSETGMIKNFSEIRHINDKFLHSALNKCSSEVIGISLKGADELTTLKLLSNLNKDIAVRSINVMKTKHCSTIEVVNAQEFILNKINIFLKKCKIR